jgi:protein SCO1/2
MTALPKNRQKLVFILAAIALLAAFFGMWSRHNMHAQNDGSSKFLVATLFNQPRTITPFQLTDTNNKPFNLANLKGHYSLIFFGFTRCPDLCPTTLALLSKSYKIMEGDKLKSLPQIIFISVDPDRDNPQGIKNYLNSFNPAFLGATGKKTQIDQLTQEMSVIYAKVSEDKSGHYSIDHSGTIAIINPEGQFAGVFTMPHDPLKIANDVKIMVNRT